MNESEVDAYLARIGATRPARPDLDALRDLQRSHLATVPFENLSIHLGERIVLDEPALLDKVVSRRRGGFCYELNGAFATLLSALGYEVSLLSARVFGADKLGPPFDHLALRVDLDEPWLADVGFGAFSDHPLRLDARDDQDDPAGVFRITESGPYGDLDVTKNGKGEYRLATRPYELRDFAPTCWWQQTSPGSHFTKSLVCSMLTESGRITLSGTQLIQTIEGERTERSLEASEVLDAYRTYFGVVLDQVPTVTPIE